jgi:hypothetical protein
MLVRNRGHAGVPLAFKVAAVLDEQPRISLRRSLVVVVPRHTLQTGRQPATFTGAPQCGLEPKVLMHTPKKTRQRLTCHPRPTRSSPSKTWSSLALLVPLFSMSSYGATFGSFLQGEVKRAIVEVALPSSDLMPQASLAAAHLPRNQHPGWMRSIFCSKAGTTASALWPSSRGSFTET